MDYRRVRRGEGLVAGRRGGDQARLLFHGHWHHRNHEHIDPAGTEVCGLNEEGRSGWAAVLDLAEMQARWIEP